MLHIISTKASAPHMSKFKREAVTRMIARALAVLLLPFMAPLSVQASPSRDLCADRPGLGTPPCTIEPGHVMIELGLGDWTRDRQQTLRTDTVQIGQTLARIGLFDHLEAQFGWNGYSHIRTRDSASSAITNVQGVGDVRIALRRNLLSPDGSKTSFAVMPYISLPVGSSAIGAGDWSGGVIVPLSFSLPHGVGLAFTPEIDAAVNQSGSGHHFAFGNVAGLSLPLSAKLSATGEVSWFRDNDPSGHSSRWLSGMSLAWQRGKQTQLDLGVNLGLNQNAPGQELYFGIAHRF